MNQKKLIAMLPLRWTYVFGHLGREPSFGEGRAVISIDEPSLPSGPQVCHLVPSGLTPTIVYLEAVKRGGEKLCGNL